MLDIVNVNSLFYCLAWTMSYWQGSGVDAYEEDRTIYCGVCDEEYDDIACWIEGSTGMGTCPKCGYEVEFEI